MRSLQHAALLVVIPMAAATAQKTVVGMSGNLFRTHGDTIWLERDSTTTRSVTHGDTVEHVTSINDQPMAELTYLVHGDSAVVIKAVNARGPVPPGTVGRSVPRGLPSFLNTMLSTELRAASAASQEDVFAPPVLPSEPRTYNVGPAIRLVQHRDTVAYIRGCEGARADTTKFLMFGADSVKRLSQPERTFGPAMSLSLTAQMRYSLMHDLPKASAACPAQR